MSKLPRVILKARRARPFFARHPWVFANSIEQVELEGARFEPEPGAEVTVYSREGNRIANGLYNPKSAIRIRLYRWTEGELDSAFWTTQIDEAIRLRTRILGLNDPQGAYRLINSESDGISGLIVDRYGSWLVLQVNSRAILERLPMFVDLLAEATGLNQILVRSERGVAEQEDMPIQDQICRGDAPESPIEIVEHDLRYKVDIRTGQKTGFFLDQRDNRLATAKYAAGRTVLDLFCHTGAFSLTALKHGQAQSALGFDTSANALELAQANALINRLSRAEFRKADVHQTLEQFRQTQRQFGLVVCDPPKFARNANTIEDALQAYLRLNLASIMVLEPDGVLVTCSCSGLVPRDNFLQMLGKAAELSGRNLQILEQRGQAPDHVISASCLESDYLKCCICRVT